MVQWENVESTAMSRIAYEDGEIWIEWNVEDEHDIYAYRAPKVIYKNLKKSHSLGKYANEVVKNYPVRKVS